MAIYTQDAYGGNFCMYGILILVVGAKSTLLMQSFSIIPLG